MDEDAGMTSLVPGECPKCGMDLVPLNEVDRTYYICPMPEDAEVISHEAGECPKCGMDLVPYNPVAEGGEAP
jgi:Cu2+-exporting ATPase